MTRHGVDTELAGVGTGPLPARWEWDGHEPLVLTLRVWTAHGPAGWVWPRCLLEDALAGRAGPRPGDRLAADVDPDTRRVLLLLPTAAGPWLLSGDVWPVNALLLWSLSELGTDAGVDLELARLRRGAAS